MSSTLQVGCAILTDHCNAFGVARETQNCNLYNFNTSDIWNITDGEESLFVKATFGKMA